ncbi:MAG: MBL fold metallo-hydrolase [Thermodesulfobacteriota bacterium]
MTLFRTATTFAMLAALFAGCAPTDLYRSRLIKPGLPVDPGVSVTWLGTAGVLVSDGRTDILIDPFVSRYGLLKVGLGFPLRPEQELIDGLLERLNCRNVRAVLVSHSHYDHSLDAPYFALRTGAVLAGSASTLNVGRGAGLAETQLVQVQPGEPLKLGEFTVRFIESRHGPALFGRVPYPGTIDQPLVPPAKASAYRLGGVYGILLGHPAGTLLHHGSAGFAPGMYDGIRADVILLGITGREDTATYLAEVPGKVRPGRVIPIHFDDFFTPLDDDIDFLRSAHVEEFFDSADRLSPPYRIETIPLGQPVRLLP